MDLALECSTSLLDMVQPFADFDWILTHKVKEDKEYREFYKASTKIKVVDNSVNELGEPAGIKDIEYALKEVGGTYVVPPDWIGNTQKTLESFEEFAKVLGPERLWPVVQGSTFEEVRDCIKEYIRACSTRRITPVLCIPYDICSQKDEDPEIMALRRALVTFMLPVEVRVHLLGFLSIKEFLWYKNRLNIQSIDTGAPILLGLQEKYILDPLESKASPTLIDMDELEVNQVKLTAIYRNLGLLRKYIS